MSLEVATATVKSRKYYKSFNRRMKLGKKFWPFTSSEENQTEIQKLDKKLEEEDKQKEALATAVYE